MATDTTPRGLRPGGRSVSRTPAELAADTAAALMRGPLTITQICTACACSSKARLPLKYVLAYIDKGLAHVHSVGPRGCKRYSWGPKPAADEVSTGG